MRSSPSRYLAIRAAVYTTDLDRRNLTKHGLESQRLSTNGDYINVEFTPRDREIAKREINYDNIYQLNAARAAVDPFFIRDSFWH